MKMPRISEGVSRKTLAGDEEVLMTPEGAKALIVNATGAAVVDLCDGTRSADEIASFIVEHIPAAELATVRADVDRIIGELAAAGLLEQG
jgi:hypothetical protein